MKESCLTVPFPLERKGWVPVQPASPGTLRNYRTSRRPGESVEELVEEGQYFEAEVISGIENAPDPDVAEVHTTQLQEDDVPWESEDRE